MMVNIILEFFVVFVDDRGITYTKREIIARKYLHRLFFADVLAVLPYDYFLIGVLTPKSTIAILRLNRLIGLIRVLKFLSK